MIFYFSGAGNSRHVARQIAAVGEELVFIPNAVDQGIYEYRVAPGESVGLVFPVYFWTMPSIVAEFFQKLNLVSESKPYTYCVCTYGNTPGAAAKMASRVLKDNGIVFDAYFGVRMPDTWTPLFDLTDKEQVAEVNLRADEEIARLRDAVCSKVTGNHLRSTTPYFTGALGKRLYDRQGRRTDTLSVDDACIGCGLCAVKCPVHAIEMRDGRPVWVKERCVMCLGCLHRCPKFAIQRGPKTKLHGQYVHE